jgi:hypothetical protein
MGETRHNLTSATTDGHHIYCGSLHPDNAECTCPIGRKATDTSVQKLHKSPADTSLHKTQTSPDDELVEAFAKKYEDALYGQGAWGRLSSTKQSARVMAMEHVLPTLLASREAAVLERAAKVAEQYILDPEKTERDNARNATAKLIGLAIRTLSKGETP